MNPELIHIKNDLLLPPALAALGFWVKGTPYLEPDAPTQKESSYVEWQCAPISSDGQHSAKMLIPAWKDKSLLKTHPDHPLLAALFSLQTRQVLDAWKKGIHGMPHVVILTGSKLARAVAPSARSQGADISPHLAGGKEIMALDHAAAAITAGHGIFSMLPNGCSVTSRGAFSEIVPAATLAACAAQIEAVPEKSATMPLPGAKPGEHPFLYALAAISQARSLKDQVAKADPIVRTRRKFSEGCSLASLSIHDAPASNRELQKFKEHIYRHTNS